MKSKLKEKSINNQLQRGIERVCDIKLDCKKLIKCLSPSESRFSNKETNIVVNLNIFNLASFSNISTPFVFFTFPLTRNVLSAYTNHAISFILSLQRQFILFIHSFLLSFFLSPFFLFNSPPFIIIILLHCRRRWCCWKDPLLPVVGESSVQKEMGRGRHRACHHCPHRLLTPSSETHHWMVPLSNRQTTLIFANSSTPLSQV